MGDHVGIHGVVLLHFWSGLSCCQWYLAMSMQQCSFMIFYPCPFVWMEMREWTCVLYLFVCLFERDCIGLDIFIGSFDLMSNANYTSKRFGMLFHVASTGPLNVWRPLLTFNPNLIPNPHPNLYKTPKSRHLRLLLLPVVIFRNLHLLFPVYCTSYFP